MRHNELRDWIGKAMDEKGFHPTEMDFAADMMTRASLIQTEVCEAMQEVKRHWGRAGVDADGLKDRVAEECADSAIRVYDLAWMCECDLEAPNTLERPANRAKNERHSLLIRLGKINSLVSTAFDTFEDSADMADDERDAAQQYAYFGYGQDVTVTLQTVIHHLADLCVRIGRDLETAIRAKMVVNMQRPHAYGTPAEGKAG